MTMQRRDFLKSAAAVLTGAVFGYAAPKMIPVVINIDLKVVGEQELLLPIKDLTDYNHWAKLVYQVHRCPSGEMLGPEWWLTDKEMARLPPQEVTIS